MPQGWSKPQDAGRLADSRAQLELEFMLPDLPGLPDDYADAGQPVRAWLGFGRERGQVLVDVRVQGRLRCICQRCLAPMDWPVDGHSRVLVLEDEAAAAGVPEEYETFLAAGGQCSLAALVAEELLLSLPLVPSHDDVAACQPARQPVARVAAVDAPAVEERQRPFADLRALLEKRRDDDS